MTADLEIKQDLDGNIVQERIQEEILCPEPPMHVQDSGEFLFKNEDELQKVIPLSPEMENNMGYNLGDNSQISTYDKLEKALFGFKLEECMEQ